MDEKISFDWISYYKSQFEQEKKQYRKNAEELANAIFECEKLQANLQNIERNPLFRLVKIAGRCKRKVRQKYDKIQQNQGVRKKRMPEKSEKKAVLTAGGHSVKIDNSADEKNGLKLRNEMEQIVSTTCEISYVNELKSQTDQYGQWIHIAEGKKAAEGVMAPGSESAYEKIGGFENSDADKTPNTAKRSIEETERERMLFEVLTFDVFSKIRCLDELEFDRECEYILVVSERQGIDPDAFHELRLAFEEDPERMLIYGHEDQIDESGRRKNPWFKPSWSPNTLLSFFYFGSLVAFRRNFAAQFIMSGDENGRRNVYELCLKAAMPYAASVTPREIYLLDRVLFHGNVSLYASNMDSAGSRNRNNCHRDTITSAAENTSIVGGEEPDLEYFLHTGETIEAQHPEFWGFEDCYREIKIQYLKMLLRRFRMAADGEWKVIGKYEPVSDEGNPSLESITIYQTQYPSVRTLINVPSEWPMVTVVIPSKDHPEVFETCVASLCGGTDYPELEIVLVDNGSSEENRSRYQRILENCGRSFRYLYEPMEFNFSRMCNMGAAASRGDLLLLLNDDIEIIEKNWLKILVSQALIPGTGAVGAKLWYPGQQRIQHVGITNMYIGPSHKLVTFPDDRTYYFGHNTLPYDMLAVTAAALLVRKRVYDSVGGLEESLRVAYNDVDLCFKLHDAGYHNVIRNDAVLIHHESLSRGLDEDTPEKWSRLLLEKKKLYDRHPNLLMQDPYYSGHLAGNAPEYKVGYLFPYEEPLRTVPVKAADAFEAKRIAGRPPKNGGPYGSAGLMLTVERAMLQRKIHETEPEIYFIEGWCYLKDMDNASYHRTVLLLDEDRKVCFEAKVHNRRRPDAEAILPDQINVGLTGFTCRIRKEDLMNAAGNAKYRVGIRYSEVRSGREYAAFSDRLLIVNEGQGIG